MTRILRQFGMCLLRGVLLSPAVILAVAAAPHLVSGIARELTFPVPQFIATGRTAPVESYRETGQILASAAAVDGESAILSAQALYLAGGKGEGLARQTEWGLSRDPASGAGWTLLAALRASADRKAAADALTVSLEFAPYDRPLAPWRTKVAAALWNRLSPDAQSGEIREIQQLWEGENDQRRAVVELLSVPGGTQLSEAALRDRPEDLRRLNRMAMRLRLGLPAGD
jgi:hypothetical protein